MTRWVYGFGGGHNDGRSDMKNLLGGKGANLAEMASIGLPVPPGFTLTTEVCTAFYDNNRRYPDELEAQVKAALAHVEAAVGQKFGDPNNPLLVSVRSGARVSMPGMMDTVLNLGLNDVTVEGLAKEARDNRFAWDSYRRFIQMYGSVVMGIEHHHFEEIIEHAKLRPGSSRTPPDGRRLASRGRRLQGPGAGGNRQPFPTDPRNSSGARSARCSARG